MAKAIDLTGQKYGRLTVIGEAPKRGRVKHWHTICDCGTEKEVAGQAMRYGQTQSCGCLQRERAREIRRVKHGHSKARNGRPSKEYQAWRNAITRCHNPKVWSYKDYGAKGIIVCDEWRNDFAAFLSYMGLCPSKDYSLDRINPHGNYEPGNCRWIPLSDQRLTRRSSVYLEYDGETLIKADWARRLGLSPGGMDYWLRKGCTIADVIAQRGIPLAAESPLAA
jgi:hypothetical protein